MKLASPLPLVEFSTVKAGVKGRSHEGVSHLFELSLTVMDSLRNLARHLKTSINMIYLAAYVDVLARECNQREVLIHVPVSGRERMTESLIGCFADTLILRLSIATEGSFRETVARTHQRFYEAMKHPIPLSLALDSSDASRLEKSNVHRAILFWEQTVSFRKQGERRLGTLQTQPYASDKGGEGDMPMHAHSILSLNELNAGSSQGVWQFKKEVMAPETMQLLVRRFETLLSLAIETSAGVHGKDVDDNLIAPVIPPSNGATKEAGLFNGAKKKESLQLDGFSSEGLFGELFSEDG